jgi:hypothetical protein
MPLPVPTLPTEVPGNFMTSALYNTLGVNGLGFSLNPPVATVYQTATQSIASTTNVAITMDSSVLDTYGGHSNTTNTSRYVGQVPGYYLVYGVICFATNATGYRVATIAKNGSTSSVNGGFGIFQTTSSVSALACAQAFGLVQLNGTTDYVEIYANQNSGSPISTAVGATVQQSMLTVWWLHA